MNRRAGIQFRLENRAALTPARKTDMFRLLAEHFDGVTPEQFARDLAEKHIALLLEREGTLVGFSTLLAYSTTFGSNGVNVIYSGDTIVAGDAWGTMALPRAWVSGVEALRAALPPGPCYWLLLTSGFRTYRFLPVFWRRFFPSFEQSTPAAMQQLLDQLASERFGNQFDPASGVVRFHQPQRLRPGRAEIPSGRLTDPHVEFFLARNPGHANGDELVCLTEISPGNLTAAGCRMTNPQPLATLGNDR